MRVGTNGVQRDLEKIALGDCSARLQDFTSLYLFLSRTAPSIHSLALWKCSPES